MQDDGQPSPNSIEPTAVMHASDAALSDSCADMHVIIAVQPCRTAGHTPAGSIVEMCVVDMQLLAFISWTRSRHAAEQIDSPDDMLVLATDARHACDFDCIDGRLVVRQSLSQKPFTADITSAFWAAIAAIDEDALSARSTRRARPQ